VHFDDAIDRTYNRHDGPLMSVSEANGKYLSLEGFA
jgi:hypothetical protein